MWKRLLLDEHVLFFGITAFVVSAGIFAAFLRGSLRMSDKKADHFANLPFNDETEPKRHDA